MLLSPHAHADSIPGLEILANDVRCTHAATIGQVDRELLFFLMSRGFSPHRGHAPDRAGLLRRRARARRGRDGARAARGRAHRPRHRLGLNRAVRRRLPRDLVVVLSGFGWVGLGLLLDHDAGLSRQRAIGLVTWVDPRGAARRRVARDARAGAARDRGGDVRRVRGLGRARAVHLPARQRAAVRAAGARPRVPLGDRDGTLARLQRVAAADRAVDPHDRRHLGGARARGPAPRPARRGPLRLLRALLPRRARAARVLRRVLPDELPRAARHRPRLVDVGAPPAGRARRHGQPAERDRGRLLLPRPLRARGGAAHRRRRAQACWIGAIVSPSPSSRSW